MTPRDWLWLIFEVAAITAAVVAFVWRAVKLPLEYRMADNERKITDGLKQQGERIGDLELSCQANSTRADEISRVQQQQAFEIASANKEIGRLEGILDRIDNNINQMANARHEEDTDIRERLARIETSIQIFGQIRDVLVMAVQSGNEKRGGGGSS